MWSGPDGLWGLACPQTVGSEMGLQVGHGTFSETPSDGEMENGGWTVKAQMPQPPGRSGLWAVRVREASQEQLGLGLGLGLGV